MSILGLFSPFIGFAESSAEFFIDNIIRDKICSPAIGSIVYCELHFGAAEHSGVYIGNDSIIHLDGSGIIEVVSSEKFLNRLGGFNNALSIYVSCRNGIAVGSPGVAQRAVWELGTSRNYNIILDNCHQFTAGCLSGNFENSCNFLIFLKSETKTIINADEWRVWDR